MKKELRNHLIPLGIIFITTSVFWFINKVSISQYIFLLVGLLVGAFLLDFDHIIYWFFIKPNTEESRAAQSIIKSKKIFSALSFFSHTHKSHTSLIFHHFFFQVVLGLISVFVFTSSTSVFVLSFLLALNIHLLTDEIEDFIYQPKHLQHWLFAREEKQLSLEKVQYYLIFFIFLSLLFSFLLIRSNL